MASEFRFARDRHRRLYRRPLRLAAMGVLAGLVAIVYGALVVDRRFSTMS